MDQVPQQENKQIQPIEHSNFWLWINSILVSILLFLVVLTYIFLESGRISIYKINSSFASTAYVLIGLSLFASSFSYFFHNNILIVHRKYIGILGFLFALSHALISLLLFKFPGNFLTNNFGIPFYLGLSALVIFLVMTIISNKYAVKLLGGKSWRYLLRLGYIGFIFVLIHFLYYVISDISSWYTNIFSKLPPIGLLLAVFGIVVLLSRLVLQLPLTKQENAGQK